MGMWKQYMMLLFEWSSTAQVPQHHVLTTWYYLGGSGHFRRQDVSWKKYITRGWFLGISCFCTLQSLCTLCSEVEISSQHCDVEPSDPGQKSSPTRAKLDLSSFVSFSLVFWFHRIGEERKDKYHNRLRVVFKCQLATTRSHLGREECWGII